MSVQNSYNNYIKRSKQNSTDQFKQKVANSLGGVAVGNNTTKKPVSFAGKVTTLGVSQTPKSNNISQHTSGGYKRPSKTYSMSEHIKTQPNNPNVLQSNITPQNGNSGAVTQQTVQQTPQQTQTPLQAHMSEQTLQQPVEPIVNESVTQGDGQTVAGLVSSDVINNAFTPVNQELSDSDILAINELASSPQVQSRAYSSGKTPQQMAQELIEMQKQQLQKDWEMKKQELELQKTQAEQSHQQSVQQAEKTYGETVDKLNENRYQQMQDLAVSGQNRGIQYSPQQLGLENVANINHNKNLAEASNQRNELLNNLSIELGKVMGQINLGLQNATNTYNSSVTDLMSDYQKTMMDWAWNEQQTADDRKWQEEQTLKDQQFQKEMQELSQKWQAEQNALDRAQGRSGGGYSGYSGYSSRRGRGYSGYSRRNYGYNNFGRSYGGNDLDLSTDEGLEAYVGTGKEFLTDAYNGSNVGEYNELENRARYYRDNYNDLMKVTDSLKNNDVAKKQFEDAYDVAMNNMFKTSHARATNTEYQIGDTIYPESKTPLKKEVIKRNKINENYNKQKFKSEFARTEKERKQAKANSMFMERAGANRTLEDVKKFNEKNKSNKHIKSTKSKNYDPKEDARQKAQQKAKKTVKKVVNKAKQNKKTVDPKEKARQEAQKKFKKNVTKVVNKVKKIFKKKK